MFMHKWHLEPERKACRIATPLVFAQTPVFTGLQPQAGISQALEIALGSNR
ncbi:hypothetical protein YSA_05559 [Pseudomonas putida ND6]|uniref:Uncharacterized protein n=1 Tax=Pseudomonas putida ND6 TaxID=231023 RepID=I3UWA6_PSEPU|nr:hypothetical protein YSA_05559 [Pseudomonas putida ND6]